MNISLLLGLITIRQPGTLKMDLPTPIERAMFDAALHGLKGTARETKTSQTVIDSGTLLPVGHITARKLIELLSSIQSALVFHIKPKEQNSKKLEVWPGGTPQGSAGLVELDALRTAVASLDPDHKIGVNIWNNPSDQGVLKANLVLLLGDQWPDRIREEMIATELDLGITVEDETYLLAVSTPVAA